MGSLLKGGLLAYALKIDANTTLKQPLYRIFLRHRESPFGLLGEITNFDGLYLAPTFQILWHGFQVLWHGVVGVFLTSILMLRHGCQ